MKVSVPHFNFPVSQQMKLTINLINTLTEYYTHTLTYIFKHADFKTSEDDPKLKMINWQNVLNYLDISNILQFLADQKCFFGLLIFHFPEYGHLF